MMFAIFFALAFILFEEKAIAKGLILGTLFSIFNFVLIGRSLPLSLGQTPAKARAVGLASILGRYVVLAVPLIVGLKFKNISFWAVVVGIFAVQIVTLIEYTIINRFFNKSV